MAPMVARLLLSGRPSYSLLPAVKLLLISLRGFLHCCLTSTSWDLEVCCLPTRRFMATRTSTCYNPDYQWITMESHSQGPPLRCLAEMGASPATLTQVMSQSLAEENPPHQRPLAACLQLTPHRQHSLRRHRAKARTSLSRRATTTLNSPSSTQLCPPDIATRACPTTLGCPACPVHSSTDPPCLSPLPRPNSMAWDSATPQRHSSSPVATASMPSAQGMMT